MDEKQKTNKYVYRGPFTDSQMTITRLNDKLLNYGDIIELTPELENDRALKGYIEQGKKIPNYTHRLIPIELDSKNENVANDEKAFKPMVTGGEENVLIDGQLIDLVRLSLKEIKKIAKRLRIKTFQKNIEELKSMIKIKCISKEELQDMTKDEINDFASENGVNKEIKSSQTKEEMINILKSMY